MSVLLLRSAGSSAARARRRRILAGDPVTADTPLFLDLTAGQTTDGYVVELAPLFSRGEPPYSLAVLSDDTPNTRFAEGRLTIFGANFTGAVIVRGTDQAGNSATLTIEIDVAPPAFETLSYTGPDPLQIHVLKGASPVYSLDGLLEGGDGAKLHELVGAPEGFTVDGAGRGFYTAPTDVEITAIAPEVIDSTTARVDFAVAQTGTFFFVLTPTADQPSKTQIEARQDHTGADALQSNDKAITYTGANAIHHTGLAPDTAYSVHFFLRTADGRESRVYTAGFATAAPGTGAATGLVPDELSFDGVIFDSRAPMGLDTTRLYEKGSAPAELEGRTIQARTQRAGAPVWVDIGAVSGGRYTGWVEYQRRAGKYVREHRVKDGDGTTVKARNGFYAGHVWWRFAQSDDVKALNYGRRFSSDAQAPHVLYPDLIRAATLPRETEPSGPKPANSARQLPVRNDAWVDAFSHISTGSFLHRLPVGHGLAANAIGAEDWPDGFRLLFITSMQNGQGVRAQADDQFGERYVSDERQIFAAGITDPDFGQTPGLCSGFISSNTGPEQTDADYFGPWMFGLNPDGSTFNPSSRSDIDWTVAEFVRWEDCRFAITVPWSSDVDQRADFEAMSQHPVYGRYFAEHWKQHDARGYLTDAHPLSTDIHGGGYAGLQTYYMHLLNANLLPWADLRPDMIELHPRGRTEYARIGWSGGKVTTTYRHAGLPRISGTADVNGLDYNGTALKGDDARICDEDGNYADRGDLWIRKPGGGTITEADLAEFRWGSIYGTGNFGYHPKVGDYKRMFQLAAAPGRNGVVTMDPDRRIADLFSNPSA